MNTLNGNVKDRLQSYSIVDLKIFIDTTYYMSTKVAGQGEIASRWVQVRVAAQELLEAKMTNFINAL
jgi:hypothetical protein